MPRGNERLYPAEEKANPKVLASHLLPLVFCAQWKDLKVSFVFASSAGAIWQNEKQISGCPNTWISGTPNSEWMEPPLPPGNCQGMCEPQQGGIRYSYREFFMQLRILVVKATGSSRLSPLGRRPRGQGGSVWPAK